jgi:PAS domain S-box-containing protein
MPSDTTTSLPGAVQRLLQRTQQGDDQRQLADACLHEALAISGAAFGWIGLLNAHKRLDTIAMSTGAWAECDMGPQGVRQLQNMPLRGLWAVVLRDRRPIIIERPDEHPERTGVPLGHVPIHCFLGVPLEVAGRTIGMIALANRPGGFQQAALGRLAPLASALASGLHHLHTEADLNLHRAILASLPDGLAVCDLAGVITQANPGFVDTWGHASESDVLGWALRDIAQLDGTQDEGSYESLVKGEGVRLETMASSAEGQHKPVELTSSALRDAQGHQVASVVIVRDLSEQKAREERMWATAVDLSRSNEDLERFAYVAARELHGPVRKVLAYGEFLENDCGHQLDTLGREYLGRILESARRQQQMVDGLLRYARIRCTEASFTRVLLGQLVRDAIGDLRPLLREVGGSIQVDRDTALRCDEPMMRMLLETLMDNGLRYHRPGVPPVLQVGASIEGEWCTIRVQDNGLGFDEQQLHQMFQVFGRLHGQREYRGTGLGLPVAQRIVEQHGGTITATSQPGRGSQFVVTLPHRLGREPFVAPALRSDTFSTDEE